MTKPNRVIIRIILVGAIAGILASLANHYVEKTMKVATKT